MLCCFIYLTSLTPCEKLLVLLLFYYEKLGVKMILYTS